MHIGCFYDSVNNVYVIFTLPYVLNLRFMILNDIIHSHFNHIDNRLDCLISMLYMKSPGMTILMGENESLSGTFLHMLKQGSQRGKLLKIKPDGIYHLEHNDHNLTPFNILEIQRRYENQLSDPLINTTITWLTWMPHIRILNIDSELLFKLSINNVKINQFSSLEILIVHQINNSLSNQPLTIINSLGTSSSLHTIHLQRYQYRANSQLTTDDLLLVLHQICHNLCRLKIMKIEFDKHALCNIDILEQFADTRRYRERARIFHSNKCHANPIFDELMKHINCIRDLHLSKIYSNYIKSVITQYDIDEGHKHTELSKAFKDRSKRGGDEELDVEQLE